MFLRQKYDPRILSGKHRVMTYFPTSIRPLTHSLMSERNSYENRELPRSEEKEQKKTAGSS
jgi:hypothetical protein